MSENRISVVDAAKLMGVSDQFVRIGLQKGVLPFGYAVRRSRWSYYISPVLFSQYTGIALEEVMKRCNVNKTGSLLEA